MSKSDQEESEGQSEHWKNDKGESRYDQNVEKTENKGKRGGKPRHRAVGGEHQEEDEQEVL